MSDNNSAFDRDVQPSEPDAQNDQQDQIIETASATTSPDNSNSGSFAYVITAVVVVATLLVSLVGAGCVSSLIAAGVYFNDKDFGSDFLDDFEDFDDLNDLDEYDDFEEWLDHHYGNESPLSDGTGSNNTGSVSVDDALDFDLAAYGTCINDHVSANAYAGTSTEVRDFVRNLLGTDRDYADTVARCLNGAARNADERADRISEAYDACLAAKDAIEAMELPAISSDESDDVRDELGTAKTEAVRRWECMANEVDLLRSDEVSSRELWRVDDDILEATEDAADEITDALASAAL